MRWRYFHLFFGKLMTGAIIAVFIIPLIADSMRVLGINYDYLRVPIIGGVIFIICFFAYKYLCPDLIAKHETQDDYSAWAVKENINVFVEFKLATSKSEKFVRTSLGDKFDILYPIERGLSNSRKECIEEYAAIEYQLTDKSKSISLYVILFLSFGSILMVNWLTIERVCRIIGG